MFHKLFKLILDLEGGYSDHPLDKGGKTKWGVTKKTATALGYDFANLTITDVEQIYFKEYYQGNKIGFLMGTDLHDFMFDWCINSGPRVIKIMQKAIGAKADGDIGPKTAEAAKEAGTLRLVQCARLKDQVRICKDDPTQEAFLVGWARRATNPIWETSLC